MVKLYVYTFPFNGKYGSRLGVVFYNIKRRPALQILDTGSRRFVRFAIIAYRQSLFTAAWDHP